MKKIFTLLTCSLYLITSFAQPKKIILVEEGTGTWCQWCPRGDIYGQVLAQNYPDNALFVAVHNGDPMENQEYNEEAAFSALPNGHIDRVVDSDMEPALMNTDLASRLLLSPPASVEVATNFNEANRLLTMEISANFVESLNGDYRLAGIVVEDGITGPPPIFDQSNSYSGGGAGPMGGYEDLPSPVPASIMVYNHVGRHLAGGYNGEEGSLPLSINSGESHTHTYTYTLPQEYNEEYVYVIGILVNAVTGEVLNAGRSLYLPGFDNGKPFFHSSPQEDGFVGLNYQYDILTHDPEHNELEITSLTHLPDGLVLIDLGDGKAEIKGIPTEEGSFEVRLNVTDGEWNIEQTFQLEIGEPQEDWIQIGNAGFSPGDVDKTDIEISPQGEIFVMAVLDNQVYVYKLENDKWTQQGTVLSAQFNRPTMALHPDGVPYVFTLGTVYKLEEGEWNQIGDQLPGPDYIFSDIIVAGDGTPFVTYFSPPATTVAYRFTGTNWEQAGTMTNGVGVWMRFKLDNQGNPLVIYGTDGSSIAYSEVAHWNGVDWNLLGSYIEPNSQTYFDHDVVMTPNGDLFAVLTIGAGEQRLNAYQLINGEWELVSDNFASGATSNCNLETDIDGNIIASYRDENLGGRTSTMKYQNNEWSYMGLPGFTSIAEAQSMAVDSDGVPYVAYNDNNESGKVTVNKYEDLTSNILEVTHVDYGLKIYPNPNDGNFILEFKEGTSYQIIDALGQIVLTEELSSSFSNEQLRYQNISIRENLQKGIFYIRIMGEKGIQVVKFVKK